MIFFILLIKKFADDAKAASFYITVWISHYYNFLIYSVLSHFTNTDEYEYDSPSPPPPRKRVEEEANRYNGSFEVSCDYLNLTWWRNIMKRYLEFSYKGHNSMQIT